GVEAGDEEVARAAEAAAAVDGRVPGDDKLATWEHNQILHAGHRTPGQGKGLVEVSGRIEPVERNPFQPNAACERRRPGVFVDVSDDVDPVFAVLLHGDRAVGFPEGRERHALVLTVDAESVGEKVEVRNAIGLANDDDPAIELDGDVLTAGGGVAIAKIGC